MATGEKKRRENLLSKGSIWRILAKPLSLLRLLKFRGWKRPPFLSLLDSCASPSAPRILFEDTRPLLLFLPSPSVETLLTKRATIPRSIPPECPGVVFRSLGTTTVTEDVGQTSVWILQSSEKCYENKQAEKQDIFFEIFFLEILVSF